MSKPGPNVIKICQVCGQEFHPNSSRQVNCNRPIKVPCAVCGKLMDRLCSATHQTETCSKECNNILIKKRQVQSGSKLTKKCKCCGKEFHPKYIREEYCEGPHYSTCELCGKHFEYNPRRELNKTCSDACRYILAQEHTDREAIVQHMKENFKAKYGEGVENPMQVPGVIEKIKETNRKKYGTDWYTQTQAYKDKTEGTCLQKYGVKHHLSSKEVIAKRNDTVKQKYGVDNVFQSEEIKDKSKQSNKERWEVEYIGQSSEIHKTMSLNRKNNITIDGTHVDSSYELKFYNFLYNLGYRNIETQVPINFEFNDSKHTTLIDFRIENRYFEAKGSHLLQGAFETLIDQKIQVYKDNRVIILTDKYDEVFNDDLIGVDIKLFDSNHEIDNKTIWDTILKLITIVDHGFITLDTIKNNI